MEKTFGRFTAKYTPVIHQMTGRVHEDWWVKPNLPMLPDGSDPNKRGVWISVRDGVLEARQYGGRGDLSQGRYCRGYRFDHEKEKWEGDGKWHEI
jgi:hypothetical protein